MKNLTLLALFALVIAGLIGASRMWRVVVPPVLSFTEQCLKDGNMWHEMPPLKNGETLPGEKRPGCMSANGLHHFADEVEYAAAKEPGESSVSLEHDALSAGESAMLRFTIRKPNGDVPELYKEHDRYIHVVIVSKDMRIFRHVHPEEVSGFSEESIANADFTLPFTFPTGGEYLIAVDYAHQLKHTSQQFRVQVEGEEVQGETVRYESPARKGDYEIDLTYALPLAGEVATLRYTIHKLGEPVVDLEPYLGAAMHVAVVKNDLTEFIHTHGEVHTPGSVPPKTLTQHVHTPPPTRFGPIVEAHAIFPSPGLYTVFNEFKHEGQVIQTANTVRIE